MSYKAAEQPSVSMFWSDADLCSQGDFQVTLQISFSDHNSAVK